jgi:hypothetical protein
MHPFMDQNLGDGISEAVAIEDAEQPIDGGLGVAVAREVVGQRDHGQIKVCSIFSAGIRRAILTQLRVMEAPVGRQRAG